LVGHRQQAARHAGAAEGGPRRGQGRQGVTLETVVFGLVALALLGGSLGVVLTPNLFHAVLSLAGALVATALIFLLLDAAFLFAVPLLLYAAGRHLLRAGRGLMAAPGLSAYLVLAALVFAIGLFGVLTRRNAVGILLGIELMGNAVNINLVAFARFEADLAGLIFTLFVIAITVAEVGVGLAIVIAIFRVRRTVDADHLNLLKG